MVQEMLGGVINSTWAVRGPLAAPADGGSAAGGGLADSKGSLLVKQAPPYVRAVGPSFPLSTVRAASTVAARV